MGPNPAFDTTMPFSPMCTKNFLDAMYAYHREGLTKWKVMPGSETGVIKAIASSKGLMTNRSNSFDAYFF